MKTRAWTYAITVAVALATAAGGGVARADPPSNDDWTDATVLSDLPATVTVDLSEATSGDHEHVCTSVLYTVAVLPDAAVWYAIDVQEDDTLRITRSDDEQVYAQVWVRTVDALGRPALRLSSCWASWYWAYEDQRVYIAVGQGNGTEPFDLEFALYGEATSPRPLNDVPYRAEAIPSLPFETTRNTTGAFRDHDPVVCEEAGYIWFSFTPPEDMTVSFEVSGGEEDDLNTLIVFEEQTSERLICRWSYTTSAQGTARLRAGVKVLINVGGWGLITLRATRTDRPPADAFADADLLDLTVDTPFSTADATLESGEPASCGTGGSIWFRVPPTGPGTIRLQANGPVSAASFTGDAVGTLTPGGCSLDGTLALPAADHARYLQIRGEGAAGSLSFTSSLGLGTQVTDASPFEPNCGDDTDPVQHDSEVEVSAAVDPSDPDHIVAAYQQDRHLDRGGAHGIGTATSTDGGRTWTTTTLPGLSICSGGPWRRATDPWASIGPDGVAYVMTLGYNPDLVPSRRTDPIDGSGGVFLHRSEDGGLTWEGPFAIATSPGIVFHDKNTLTADPTTPGRLYATWQQIGVVAAIHVVSRSDDGGRTWLPPIPLPGGGTGDQIAVLGDGTLVHISGYSTIRAMTSRDGGLTWSVPVVIGGCNGGEGPPNVRGGNCIPAVSTDGSTVHVSWVGRTSIGVASSSDAGASWDLHPIETPLHDRFTAAVATTPDGDIAVTSYRLPGFDYGSVHLMLSVSEDGGDTWRERPITKPFDLRRAPYSEFRGYFLGDYMSLVRSGDAVVAVYTAVPDGTRTAVANVYAQRLDL